MVPRMESSCYEIVEYGRERYHKQGYILLTRSIEPLLQNFNCHISMLQTTEEEAAVKATTFMEFEELLKNEEIDRRQLCKMLQLKEGDNNAKFFNNSTNAHKRSNYIDLLEVQRGTLKEPDRVKEEIIQFYKKLYTETERWRPAGNAPKCPHNIRRREGTTTSKF
ncbi:hypothetical protein MTR67_020126 [Solanum verrucosum]|uniref:Uncharacterized protein n=1 Tax=Solanum verrucosum TaxID=315347 RepID=A0AAF0QU75_SOLVR|nr:hypothetical protein MTR67_020126 [Solanum verrucosum]